mmetsp:Transcript_17904/g.38440  ORF Transcript_17904/g.38440 Transcript_17904/m.38440 type:complete len:80 (-) Transcript_17904:449-688(-)|eukprot:CAMPEP_0202889518 /NCGR_PEP_ID=MMETSP1392-20130828/96_1 /ASSEMBLY_ACC=CAM_ASM_000868 /TAXON_ID=225041 /ORGANISM="Chlamydomonas chlamydogama, Strain SAG 11-48b" /LENGTH=79 /DNA_ID=CAMNT_0049572865 /DNA_START=37 /DNA_END=276 /DNA_ORIENTATION=+
MSAAGSGPFYRAAGMTYLRYSNICADLLRNVLKEPHKAKAKLRQVIAYRYAPWAEGKAGKSTVLDIKDGMPVKESTGSS